MEREIKIALVDDHALFRNGLRGLIDGNHNCRVVAEASDGAEFLESNEAMSADVVFMDIAMPTLSGDKATALALERNPQLKIICLSMFGDEKYYSRMVEAGAKGFLLKDSSIMRLALAGPTALLTITPKTVLNRIPFLQGTAQREKIERPIA